MDHKILRLLVIALGFLILLVVGLAILFSLSLKDVRDSVRTAQKDADIVKAIKSLQVVNGRDGADGLSVVGPQGTDGQDGANSVSTLVIQQVPIQGPKGDKGDAASPSRQVEFDGAGHWKFADDEEWLPLFDLSLLQTPVTPLLEAE